jgi:Ni/Co efflux regulator RcnB
MPLKKIQQPHKFINFLTSHTARFERCQVDSTIVIVENMALPTIQRRHVGNTNNMDQSTSNNGQQRRIRSQTIKIPKQTTREYGHYTTNADEMSIRAWEEDVAQLEDMYKSATMQMYYRITDYRLRSASVFPDVTSSPTTQSLNHQRALPLPTDLAVYNDESEDATAVNATYNPEENGAIFEMDL